MDYLYRFAKPLLPTTVWRALLCMLLAVTCLPGYGGNHAPSSLTKSRTAEQIVTGRVTDATTNEALAGCTVLVKGTGPTFRQKGATTDANGDYRIAIPDGQTATLVFGFIGFVSKEIAVGNQTVINVALSSSSAELTQVVVVGYGSTTQRETTGSIKSVKSADFNRGIINSPEQLLQGKVAGVNVTSASGEPGSTQSITIRGPGGVRTGSTPLFVLDGIPLDNSSTGGATNPLNFLNPQDIEAIDVLKDASATAIYGARGANGVVLITTKKGKAGASSINLSANMGISNLTRPLPVFSADEYRQQVVAVGGVLDDQKGNTNWQKEISRQAITQNYNLAFSGGADKLTYYASFGVQSQEGILKNSKLNRYTGRVNATQKFLDDRLVLDLNLTASYTGNERPPIEALVAGAISANPTYPAYDATGAPYKYQGGTNPLITLALQKDLTTINRVVANLSPSYKLTKDLTYKLNLGVDNSNSVRDLQSLANAVPQQDGRLESIYLTNRNLLIENYFTYTKSFGSHNLTALLGHSYQNFFIQGRNWSVNKFPISSIEPIYNPGLGQDLILANNRPGGYAIQNELQ